MQRNPEGIIWLVMLLVAPGMMMAGGLFADGSIGRSALMIAGGIMIIVGLVSVFLLAYDGEGSR
jgi:hypothetical protein